ncbi:MAG: acyl-CoA synthetase [Bacteroidales bacterium]
MIELIERARRFGDRIAIRSGGRAHSYDQLLERSGRIARLLLNGTNDLKEARVAFLVPAGYDYVCIQWGIWRAGGIAVPLCEKHPTESLQYVIDDTGAAAVLCAPEFESLIGPLKNLPAGGYIRTGDLGVDEQGSGEAGMDPGNPLPDIGPERRAMILYTSGTTGLPKGVVTTHANIRSQITALTTSWEWDRDDHVLNVLPLHHVHGIINLLSCALWSGACCQFLPKFDAGEVFGIFGRGEVNVFMAVPTIYFKLLAHFNTLPAEEQAGLTARMKRFRLMVSGSAALPVSVFEEWEKISGHVLLERYGMTEMGMAISNPYRGERRPGHIGQPLPGVGIRLADEFDQTVEEGSPGEIQIKGENVFREYWGKEQETAQSFTADGWFRSGDMAVLDEGSYKILGRNSVDIIKSGGYKISALEIEEVLRTHPAVKDCGVVGIPDLEWGEVIGASLVPVGEAPDLEALKAWLLEKLPSYKVPRRYILQDDLPRNVLGKVTKNELKTAFTKTAGS